jgi:hypothetical protein
MILDEVTLLEIKKLVAEKQQDWTDEYEGLNDMASFFGESTISEARGRSEAYADVVKMIDDLLS